MEYALVGEVDHDSITLGWFGWTVIFGQEATTPERSIVAFDGVICRLADEAICTEISVILDLTSYHLIDLEVVSANFSVMLIDV